MTVVGRLSRRPAVRHGAWSFHLKPFTRPLLTLAPLLLGAFILACGSSSEPTVTPSATTAVVVAVETPSPSPTATAPSLTPTATATVSPTPTGPARTESAPANRLADEAGAFLESFTRDLSPRASATEQESAAAGFLAAELESLGYDVKLQKFEFDMPSSEVTLPGGLDGAPSTVPSHPLTLSGIGESSGVLVNVGKGLPEEVAAAFAEISTGGSSPDRIALIERGEIPFEEKVKRVADVGVAGVIVYNNRPGLFAGALATQAAIPVVAITRESGAAAVALLSDGEVTATVSAGLDALESRNVVAEKPGPAPDSPVVVLGGHFDTVPDVPGANDNGSGIATLMTIAGEVADEAYPFTLRLVAFGSEELGLFGSRWYVTELTNEERESTIAMLNFDALAGGTNLGVLGNDELVSDVVDLGERERIPIKRHAALPGGGSSDHASFQEAGIPTVFFLDEDLSRIHTPEDKLEFINAQSMGDAAALAVGLLDRLTRR